MPQEAKWAKHAKPGPYVTNLHPDDEKKFQSWVKENKIPWKESPTSDYDMRGFWKASSSGTPYAKRDPQTKHFPDTWKTPYHETFSNESKYALPTAGHWEGEKFVPPQNTDEIAGQERLTAEKALGHEQEPAKVPTPAPLQHEFSKVPYSAAAPKKEKSKSEMEKSLEWAAQQRKVAESQ